MEDAVERERGFVAEASHELRNARHGCVDRASGYAGDSGGRLTPRRDAPG
jgi:hypothetical protein